MVFPPRFTLGWIMHDIQEFSSGREESYESPSWHILGGVIHNCMNSTNII